MGRWKRGKHKINVGSGARVVSGWTNGRFGVRKGDRWKGAEGQWIVTHLATGGCVGVFRDRKSAEQWAEKTVSRYKFFRVAKPLRSGLLPTMPPRLRERLRSLYRQLESSIPLGGSHD